MRLFVRKKNSRAKWLVYGLVAVGVLGGLLLTRGIFAFTYYLPSVTIKLRGDAPDCPWPRIFSIYRSNLRFNELKAANRSALSIRDRDEDLRIDLISAPGRPFWIRRGGEVWDGGELLAHLIAEHDWIAEDSPRQVVRSGDIVLDCGAHVGVFTNKALQLGASKIVAIEPDPVNFECLRRNFAEEIAAGRVVLVEKGVWSSAGTLTLSLGVGNSGGGSMVWEEGGSTIEVPVTTIDSLVQELRLPRVDYIKMDIEGAEREALKGGTEVLRRFRPRLMLDSYHLPDDMEVLPAIIRRAHSDYSWSCGPCELDENRLVPHAIFYE
jgi:FkbM family methyltransferase